MKALLLCLVTLLAACHHDRPPAPSAEQAQQLNEAEDLLNGMAANEEGPADRSVGPSDRAN